VPNHTHDPLGPPKARDRHQTFETIGKNTQIKQIYQKMRGGGRIWEDQSLTRLLLLAIFPLGDREVDLLAGRRLGIEGLLQQVLHLRNTDIGVADLGHPRSAPKGHHCHQCRHRISPTPLLLTLPASLGEWRWEWEWMSHTRRAPLPLTPTSRLAYTSIPRVGGWRWERKWMRCDRGASCVCTVHQEEGGFNVPSVKEFEREKRRMGGDGVGH
jgi:hypothetical protein